jgi:mRNA-degrading endonuclease RelE of RelBE toxin-antitoxin system
LGAGETVSILCSEQAHESMQRLPSYARDGIEKRLDYLMQSPRMYAITGDERFPGCRAFWIDPCYRVFYMVAAGGDDVYVVAVTEEDVLGMEGAEM